MRTTHRLLLASSLLALASACGSSNATPPATETPAQTTSAATSGGTGETAPASTTPATTATTPAVTTEATATSTTPATTPPASTTSATTPATTTTTTTTTTPAAGTTPATPAGGQSAAQLAARGRQVFPRACGNCHEADDSDGPSPNKNWEEARMRTQVRQGGGRMRPIPASRLSDADLDALIAYFRTTHAVR